MVLAALYQHASYLTFAKFNFLIGKLEIIMPASQNYIIWYVIPFECVLVLKYCNFSFRNFSPSLSWVPEDLSCLIHIHIPVPSSQYSFIKSETIVRYNTVIKTKADWAFFKSCLLNTYLKINRWGILGSKVKPSKTNGL